MNLKLKNFLLFVIFAAAIFIPIGLFSLTIGPSRWLANYAKKVEWNGSTESSFQKFVILLLILISIYFAYRIVKNYLQKKTSSKRIYVVLGLSSVIISLAVFTFQPEILNANKLYISASKNEITTFEFGPYPDKEKLNQLKKEGYNGVVSLLHPMVVPAEPVLLNKELKIAKSLGLKVISIPMLPWISENEEAIGKIKKLAQTAKGKYYVHCSLGRDRAGVFKKIIETENQQILIKSSIKHNQITVEKPFERGSVYVLSKDIYFTSYPTDEELFQDRKSVV